MEKARKGNCTLMTGHQFQIVKSHELKEIIKHLFPKMKAPVWICEHCGNVTESN